MESTTVTKIVSGFGKIFSETRLSAKSARTQAQCELYNRLSHPSVFGIAFNIMLDYELYCKGYTNNYFPKGFFNDESIKNIRNITNFKKRFTPTQIYFLVRAEQRYRSGFVGKNNEEELEKFILDYSKLNELVNYTIAKLFINKKNIVVNPNFDILSLNIYGDGDFIIDGVLYEIKCTSKENCTTTTIRQLITYYLLNDLLKGKYKIEKFGYYNPLRKQITEFKIEINDQIINKWDEFIIQRYWSFILSKNIRLGDIKDEINNIKN